MLADQLYVRPLGRSNFAQSPEQRARTELIQFIAKRFLHCDKLPARRAISTAIAPISGIAPQWRYFWGAQAASLEFSLSYKCKRRGRGRLPRPAGWQPALPRQENSTQRTRGTGEILQSEPKTPGKQRSGVGPNPGFGIAQDHYDDVAPRARTACYQTVTGRFGVAGFHSVAKRKPLQNLVGVFQFAGPTVGVAKNKLGQTDDGTNRRIRVSSARDNRKIACGGILAGNREPVRIQKMRMSRAQKLCFCIHSVSERFDAAGVIARQTTRYIVGTFHQQCAQQIYSLIIFSRSNIQPHWLCESVDRFYSNRSIEVTGFRYNQRGQQLLCARGRPRLIGVFLV